MFEIVTNATLPQFEAFIEAHPKGHFLQSKLWAPVKPDWTWEGILSRDDRGEIRGAMSVLIRKMPGVPYKLMYAARGPVCDLEDAEALKDLTDGAAHLAKKNKAYALRIDPDVPSCETSFIDSMNTIISGRRVTSSSNIPNRLPKSMKISTVMQTAGVLRSRRRRMI